MSKKDEGLFAGNIDSGPHPLCVLHSAKIDGIIAALADLKAGQAGIREEIGSLHTVIHVGNGHPPITGRLAKLEQGAAALVWLAGAGFLSALGAIVTLLVNWLERKAHGA